MIYLGNPGQENSTDEETLNIVEISEVPEGAPKEEIGPAYLNRDLFELFPQLLNNETVVLNRGKVVEIDIANSTDLLNGPLHALAAELFEEHTALMARVASEEIYNKFVLLTTAGDAKTFYAPNGTTHGCLAFALNSQRAFYHLVNENSKYEPIKEYYEDKEKKGEAKPPYSHIGITNLSPNDNKLITITPVNIGRPFLMMGGNPAEKLAVDQMDLGFVAQDPLNTKTMLKALGELGINSSVDGKGVFKLSYDTKILPNLIRELEASHIETKQDPKKPFDEEAYRELAGNSVPPFMRDGYRRAPEHFVEGSLPQDETATALTVMVDGMNDILPFFPEQIMEDPRLAALVNARAHKVIVEKMAEILGNAGWEAKEALIEEKGNLKLILSNGVYTKTNGINMRQIASIFECLGTLQNEDLKRILLENLLEDLHNGGLSEITLEDTQKLKLTLRAGLFDTTNVRVDEKIYRTSDGKIVTRGPDQILGPAVSNSYRLATAVGAKNGGIALTEELANSPKLATLRQFKMTKRVSGEDIELKGMHKGTGVYLIQG